MMREQEIVLKQIHAWYMLHYRPAMLKTDLQLAETGCDRESQQMAVRIAL